MHTQLAISRGQKLFEAGVNSWDNKDEMEIKV